MEDLDRALALFGVQAFLLAGIVFVPLERLLALRKDQRVFRDGWRNDLVYIFVNGAVVRMGVGAALFGAAALAHGLVPPGLRTTVAAQPYWLQTLAAIVVADLGFYAAHRMFHRVPLLWKFHAVHHSIEALDWLAAARVHPLDQIVTKGVSLAPLVVLGFAPVPVAIFSAIYFWHSLLLHANVRLGLGPISGVIASPAFHHWHHANEAAAHDTNFAGQLAILDRLFGTLHLPLGRLPARYGTDMALPQTYLGQTLYPFARQEDRGDPLAPPRHPQDIGRCAK